jgi:hypothetical protein
MSLPFGIMGVLELQLHLVGHFRILFHDAPKHEYQNLQGNMKAA